MDDQRLADGFRGQVMHVLPRPLLAEAARHAMAGELYPTDIGWFPRARGHFRERDEGADQHILIFCVGGEGWFDLDGRRGRLESRRALLIPRGRPHAYGADDRSPWSIHWVHFTGEDAAYFGGLVSAGDPVVPVDPSVERRLASLFGDCRDVFSDGVTHNRILYAAQVLRHLLAALFFDNAAFSPGVPSGRHRNLDASIAYMKQRLADRVTVGDLARQAGLSAARYSMLFRAQTGHSPWEHFLRLRIQAACRLLDTTDLTIKEIAAAVGCEDPYYFSRLFRRLSGQSPRDYRRTVKG